MQPLEQVRSHLQRKESGTQYRTLMQVLHLDGPLLISISLLMIFGFFILYSASNQSLPTLIQAFAHALLAFVIMFLLAQLPPSLYESWSPAFFGVNLFLLAIVLIVGHIGQGAQRWINLGLFRFQPSELMRLSLPMMLAWYFANRPLPPTFKDLSLSGLMILIPVALTAKEPDLGTAIILATGGACILLFSGIRWRHVFAIITAIFVSAPIAWRFMHGYQKQRILTFLNPERDPRGSGYHIIQSKIAIGSGGLFGKGWLHGTQSHLHFLPAHATDFIFAVCGEEFGLIGASFLLLLYLLIVSRCLYIAYQSQDTYTRLLAGTLSFMFFISVFVNIGMVSGILPVVGLPLPLISYGGSSMTIMLASFGILMSIHGHRKLLSK